MQLKKIKTTTVIVLAVVLLAIFASIFMLPQTVNAAELTSASGAVLMETTSKRVMYSKNADKRLPMASTTKIVTALTVLKNANLDDVVEIPQQAVGVEGSSIYLRAGEHLTVLELLYGLMLRSGNDTAVALALHTSGSVEEFSKLMNQTAKECGAVNSNFVNPHGLHDDNHYTTANDLGLITCYALENEDFAKIVSTKKINISNEGYDYQRVLLNKNKLLANMNDSDGVKTGYTKKAGRCFVGSATRGDMQLVGVVLNCGPMFENTQSMLEYGFSNYTMTNIVPKNKVCGVTYDKKEIHHYCENSFSYPLTKNEISKIDKQIELPKNGDRGKVTVKLHGNTLFESELSSIKK